MATLQPERIKAMVVVSATMYFPEQARAIMRQIPAADKQPVQEWERMRKSHKLGDQQITSLWDWMREMQASYDDMNFTPPSLSRITASTLIVYGDRDPLYPVEMAIAIYRAIPHSALCVMPNGGHGPAFGEARCSVRGCSTCILSNCFVAATSEKGGWCTQGELPGSVPGWRTRPTELSVVIDKWRISKCR